MNQISNNIATIRKHIPKEVTMVCVSKFHPIDAILSAYHCGERDFAESRVQELVQKHKELPKDIHWHFIGHLQTNKVKMIIPFIHLIHSVDSLRLIETINKEAEKIKRTIPILLEVHVAKEATKIGFTPQELDNIFTNNLLNQYPWIKVCGVMGMATNTDDQSEWRRCFQSIKAIAQHLPPPTIISMGMSEDYAIAIEEGSTMVRIGSSIFGQRL